MADLLGSGKKVSTGKVKRPELEKTSVLAKVLPFRGKTFNPKKKVELHLKPTNSPKIPSHINFLGGKGPWNFLVKGSWGWVQGPLRFR